jgi:hypothetical protein
MPKDSRIPGLSDEWQKSLLEVFLDIKIPVHS